MRDADKSIFPDVDSAMVCAMVWCMGHLVGVWPYGYREAFSGRYLVIVRGKPGQPEMLQLTAQAGGLKTGFAWIKTD